MSCFDLGFNGEDDWFIQAQRGAAARSQGFLGCCDRDEQGTVYIIPMFGMENKLKKVK